MSQIGAKTTLPPDIPWPFYLLLALLLSACAGVQPQRNDPNPCAMGGRCGKAMIERAETYRLGYVQFDDAGRYAQPGQVDRVLEELGTASASGLILVGFTHGWKEDVGEDRWSVSAFKDMLAAIAEQERGLASARGQPPRQVAGVFLGWPGRSPMLPPLVGLSWFDRADAAERIARGDYGNALLRLRQLRGSASASGTGNQLILIGHSLGATMLFQRLVKEPLRGPDTVLTPVADLVLLLSPSIPAADVTALEKLSPADRAALPPVMAITSQDDATLRLAFPLGQWLENPGTAASIRGQTQAMGLYPPLITHRLELSGSALTLAATGARTGESGLLQITANPAVMRGHKDIANPWLVNFIGHVTALQLANQYSRAALASAFPAVVATP